MKCTHLPHSCLATDSFTKLDTEQKQHSVNYSGGERTGQSWTDKVMGVKSNQQPREEEKDIGGGEVDDDEWVSSIDPLHPAHLVYPSCFDVKFPSLSHRMTDPHNEHFYSHCTTVRSFYLPNIFSTVRDCLSEKWTSCLLEQSVFSIPSPNGAIVTDIHQSPVWFNHAHSMVTHPLTTPSTWHHTHLPSLLMVLWRIAVVHLLWEITWGFARRTSSWLRSQTITFPHWLPRASSWQRSRMGNTGYVYMETFLR